jgi:membrane protease YdiL (CAAX protease family)
MSTIDEGLSPFTRTVRRHPVTSFLVWFFTVGQAFAFAPLVLAANGIDVVAQPFFIASTLVGLLLPAVVITRVVDGPAGVRALWRRALDVRVALGWYVLALLLVPALTIGTAVLLLGAPAAVPPLGSLLVGAFLVPLAVTFLPNNLWEEVAWTGFVQARLQARRGPVLAALITAPLFALQHVALAAGNGPATAVLLMSLLVVLAVPFRFLVGWVYNRTGSLFLVGLIHAAGNAAATGSGLNPGVTRALYPDDATATMLHLVVFFVIGFVVLVATRGRLAARRPSDAVEETASAGPGPSPEASSESRPGTDAGATTPAPPRTTAAV